MELVTVVIPIYHWLLLTHKGVRGISLFLLNMYRAYLSTLYILSLIIISRNVSLRPFKSYLTSA